RPRYGVPWSGWAWCSPWRSDLTADGGQVTNNGGSELLVLGERGVLVTGLVVLVVVAGRSRRVEPGRAVLEVQTHLVQLRLDLVDGLGAEVADVEQVRLAATDEFTHGVDALALEAVVGAHRQVQVLDR